MTTGTVQIDGRVDQNVGKRVGAPNTGAPFSYEIAAI